jgi:hypothetical protein
VNVLLLCHDFKERGVLLQAVGEKLLVDTPVGELTYDDKAALARSKPALLKVLSSGEALRDDRPRFDAKPSCYLGYTRLYDPVGGEWHDFPTRDCYPSIVELASKNRGEG